MPKRILLINPSNPTFKSGFFSPLGLVTAASHIPEKYEVRLIDEDFEKIDYDCDLAAITSNSLTIRRAFEISNEFMSRGIPVILGGIHSSLIPEESAKHATSVVIGNGETAWDELLKDFEKGRLKKFYRAELLDMSKSKVPNRDLLRNSYTFDSIETSRGCPFNCEFCAVTQLHGAKYRYKPLSLVRKELDSIKKKHIFVVDDNFLGIGPQAEKRTVQLLKLLKEYDLSWFGQTSINIAEKPDILRLARESGAMSFFIGFESLNEEFLKQSNKAINLAKGVSSYKGTVKKIHDYGIPVMGAFIVGTDYDTMQGLAKLKEFISETGIDNYFLTPLTPIPGTRLYERFRKEKRLFNNTYWLEDPYPIFTFKPRNLTVQELYEACMDILDELKLSKNIRRFARTLISTRNVKGSVLTLVANITHHNTYKKHLQMNLVE